MALVHTFPLLESLSTGFRIPIQYLGTSETPAARAIEDSLLLSWISENLPTTNRLSVQTATGIADGDNVAISSEINLCKIVVIGTTTGTFSLGTTLAGTDVLEDETFDTAGAVFVLERYFAAGAMLYFSGHAGTITVKFILINLAA